MLARRIWLLLERVGCIDSGICFSFVLRVKTWRSYRLQYQLRLGFLLEGLHM